MFSQQPTASAAQKQPLGRKKVGAMEPTMSSRLTASNIFDLSSKIKNFFFARAKRMFHVCLGVSHERECFQEIAEGLSYKAVKLFLQK